MKTALIDIGSNTIRLVIYENNKEIKNTAVYAGLISDVSDGKISPEGIFKIISALNSMKKTATEYECGDIYAFATASLRDISDKDGLCGCIYESTGIKIEIISAEKEAYYDFLGLKSVLNIDSGAAFDLGGGSCQIIVFEKNLPRESASFKIGSQRLYDEFVSGVIPSEEEIGAVRRYVRRCISDMALLKGIGCEKIYAMGGAVFALCALKEKYFPSGSSCLTKNDFKNIMTLSEDKIKAVVPKRLKTVIPAAATMLEILNYTAAEQICATGAGVRDGILAEKTDGMAKNA